jgi:electron transfer flavoprotein beta subunit
MDVLIAVTEVATLEDDFEIEDDAVDERYVTRELNEWDEYAVEAGVSLTEEHGGEVVAATVGPERVEERVQRVLAMGADRAVRVWDDALADVGVLDVGTKAALLGAVVAEEEPDVVLAGVVSSDDNFGGTGVALAERVGYEWASLAADLSVAGETATVGRELEGGVVERVEVALPAVVTVQTGLNEPRYASLRGIRQAQSKEIAVRTPADLGVGDLDSALDLLGLEKPTAETETQYLEGAPGEQASALAGVLREEGVVGDE